MVGFARAILWNSSTICLSSTVLFFKKFRRAGTLKNKFLTDRLVPGLMLQGSCFLISVASTINRVPNSELCNRVLSSSWATAAMEARASPRNPMVLIENKSDDCLILDVACLSRDIRASVSDIPHPLSVT